MCRTLFALCREKNKNVVRRVPLERGVQDEVEQMFEAQERQFFDGKDEPIEFNGDWKPDGNELLSIRDPALLGQINETRVNGAGAYPLVDILDYASAGIKALFMHSRLFEDHILVQKFQTSQYLQRKSLTLTFNANIFGKLNEHGFSLGEKLSAVIKSETVMFESFPVLRSFLTVQEHFEAATAHEIDEFAKNSAFSIENKALFDSHMDERCRKLIRGIKKSRVLQNHNASDIISRAASVGLNINEVEGRIVLPTEKRDLKVVLSFLEESVYKGIFSADTFVTNSKRSIN
ncbi:hypothetical protein Q4544_09950 [Cognatishimia sp. 1_MG-2023]|uniref:hypothetical protein n=1 Tax=Cognatishimia sp. 1_MG-2023 TaxID=3062642 RepID=UPI0026E243A4|nr:hypothetical protein [Cognatishimia sp. 1_MG-2023]MDO6727255.1 hypothetical protein [Cognatishimia sp. 1_MG-2023]